MEQILRQLSKYGPVSLQFKDRYWKIGCMVRLPTGQHESFVKLTGQNLYFVLREILKMSAIEYKVLTDIAKSPSQQKMFEVKGYGTGSGYKEIV